MLYLLYYFSDLHPPPSPSSPFNWNVQNHSKQLLQTLNGWKQTQRNLKPYFRRYVTSNFHHPNPQTTQTTPNRNIIFFEANLNLIASLEMQNHLFQQYGTSRPYFEFLHICFNPLMVYQLNWTSFRASHIFVVLTWEKQ